MWMSTEHGQVSLAFALCFHQQTISFIINQPYLIPLQSNRMVLFRELCKLLPRTLVFWLPTCSEQFANRHEQLAHFSCEFGLCHLKTVPLISMANSFLNWNFNLEYYPAGEIRVLSCERQCGANLFLKATTTNFNKQNSKLKPQHSFIVYKSNFITTANLIAFHWLK